MRVFRCCVAAAMLEAFRTCDCDKNARIYAEQRARVQREQQGGEVVRVGGVGGQLEPLAVDEKVGKRVDLRKLNRLLR